MRRKAMILIVILLLGMAAVPGTALSQRGAPLPPLPPAAILEAVLEETGGAEFVPLRAPNYITRELGRFGVPFRGVQGLLDVAQTVSYFDLEGVLREAVMPLKESRASQLAPTMQAPPDGAAGQVIAATYDPVNGVLLVVAVFPLPAELPSEVRFYRSSGAFEAAEAFVRMFEDVDRDGMVDPVDDGAIIAYDRTCVTVGLQQVCWAPFSEDMRDPLPSELTEAADERLRRAYDFEVLFDTERAMPDIMGRDDRGECARALSGAPPFQDVPGCVPNLAFAAAAEMLPGEPIAMFAVPDSADIRTYSASGAFVGELPAGDYLVLDATPRDAEPGMPALLFLVNADGRNHYLIPAVVAQGFAEGDDDEEDDPRQAAIKDGYASYRGWGS